MAEPPPVYADPPDSTLVIPPIDEMFFPENLIDEYGENSTDDVVVELEDLDFDFSFDDLRLPSSDFLDDLLNPNQTDSETVPDPNFLQIPLNLEEFQHAAFKSTSSELRRISGDGGDVTGDQSSNGSVIMSPAMMESEMELESNQVSGYLNVQSPESNGSNHDGSNENGGGDVKGLDFTSPETGDLGKFGSDVSENSMNNCAAARSGSSSPDSNNSSVRVGVVDQKIKLEGSAVPNCNSNRNKGNSSLMKRKKEVEDVMVSTNVESSRISKYRKYSCNEENNETSGNEGGLSEEDEKRRARLMRNRESAQLSRQRKKHYVEELEDKVKNMHSAIQDLNAKISFFMAENATLRQQMGSAGGGGQPPQMAPPPPGMYPHPAMMYPWMPCAPPYMVKSQGSQVPLVPIPRLKPQQPAQAPKSKKADSKKNEGPKTKKVASVTFLGLLFFMMLFGGLVPMVNVKYGGVREAFTGGQSYVGGALYERHHGRVLMVNGTDYGDKQGGRREFNGNGSIHCDQKGAPSADEFTRLGNTSEPLVASLYVPRNDKLVKIDGNLIIHSILASEKASASKGKEDGETGLAVPGDLSPAIPVPGGGKNGAMHPQQSKATDGKLQQWFREGLAGPMLSSGMCTEVFQFDVSSAIVPATATRNITEEQNQNSTHLSKQRNRRILHGLPIHHLHNSSHNITREPNSQKENLNGNNNTSSMVVSVLVDPREAGEADVDGVMGKKSLSRIFVVVLIDSVKYVTYSCILPFVGSPPLVTN